LKGNVNVNDLSYEILEMKLERAPVRVTSNSMRRAFTLLFALLAVPLSTACEDNDVSPPPAYPPPPDPAQPPRGDPTTTAQAQAQDSQEIQIGVDDTDTYADTDPSAVNDFRPSLEGHGDWVEDANYGTVWVPSRAEVGADFVPYQSAGHWVYEDDYVWVSDYPWGWAPYHYGRWVWIDGHGWCWIPGRRYAGAWVVWRTGPEGYGYVGWAPMPPAFIWYGGVAVVLYGRPEPRYVYVPRGDVFAPVVAQHVVVGERAAVIARETRPFDERAPYAGGRAVAQPVARGPAPSSLGIDSTHIARPATADPNLTQARNYAHPSTAQPLGAKPATPHVVRAPTYTPPPSYRPPTSTHPPARGGGRHR
jgi:hypothetical protein